MSYEIRCTAWKPLDTPKNTLCGFASFVVAPPGFEIRDCPVHRQNDKAWVQMPGRPWVDQQSKTLVLKEGRIQYSQVLAFPSRGASDDFKDKAVQALSAFIKRQRAEPPADDGGASPFI